MNTTEQTQREKFESWWERAYHNGNPPRFGWENWRDGDGYKIDDDESELDGMWNAWQAANSELVEALESRADAEPVYQVRDWHWYDTDKRLYDEAIARGDEGRILYTRPQPAPVVVPDDFDAWAKAEGLVYELYGLRSVNNATEIARKAWLASRAAMLQGAEPVSNPYTLPECFDRLFKHAHGLTFGDDWNRGTAAKYHRDSLIKAVDDCRAMLAAAPQQEAE